MSSPTVQLSVGDGATRGKGAIVLAHPQRAVRQGAPRPFDRGSGREIRPKWRGALCRASLPRLARGLAMC
jgi:hypothetical protein